MRAIGKTLYKLRRRLRQAAPSDGLRRLNLGCGRDYRPGWINIDASPESVCDQQADFTTLGQLYDDGSIAEIQMIHSIGYLRLFEARDLFRVLHRLLAPGGKLVIETPDVVKSAKQILAASGDNDFLDAVRAFYAFDLEQVRDRIAYQPYAFGWTSQTLCQELRAAGFREAVAADPQTHGPRPFRDTRIETTK